MTRSELIFLLSKRFPQLSHDDVACAVSGILGGIARTLEEGKRVEIRGFGSFQLSYRPPRLGRNPKTGEIVDVPTKWVPHFKPGKELRELVEASGKFEEARKYGT